MSSDVSDQTEHAEGVIPPRPGWSSEGTDDYRPVLIAQIATLGVFKIVTSIMILYFFPSWHALLVVIGLSIPWVLGGCWYAGFYSRIKLRLIRVRARRKKLLYQEWHVD